MPVRAAASLGVMRACSLSNDSRIASPFSRPAIQSRLSNGGLVIEKTLILRVQRTVMRDYRANPSLCAWDFACIAHKLHSSETRKRWSGDANYRTYPGLLLYGRPHRPGACT